MFEGFVNPGLVIGASLAAVPLIIHLLNRQRHRPMQWAAMRFVLAAYRKTRKRVQIENLLLLLLRMAAVALLALAIARPFTGGDSPLAGLTERRRDVVLVLDGSASTGYREEVETVFDRITDRAREILQELDTSRGDRARLILAGAYPRTLALADPDKALSVLETLGTPTDERLDLAEALGRVAEFAESDAAGTGQSALEIRLLSDLQRSAFTSDNTDSGSAVLDGETRSGAAREERRRLGGAARLTPEQPEEPGQAPALNDQLDRLNELGLQLLVEDLGSSSVWPPNLGILRVEPLARSLGAGALIDVAVEIANWGERTVSVRVVLELDGERRPSQLLDLAPRERGQAIFPVTFREPGAHVLTARLEGDRLALDDTRHRVVRVPPPVSVLAVNGAPGPTIGTLEEDELGYLMTVLEPPAEDNLPGWTGRAPFEPTSIEPTELGRESFDLGPYDVIWLANVENLSLAAVERLERRVASGASLIISLGDRTVPETYNQRLFAADGSGLLPAELARVVAVASRRQSYFRVANFAETHPILEFFSEERWRPLLSEVPFYGFVSSRPLPDARVLASFDDDASSALLIERAYDRGRVFLWTSTIDPAWTRLPQSPRTLVPLVHEFVRYAGSQPAPPCNVGPGDALVAELDEFPRRAEFSNPDGSRRVLDGEPQPAGPGRWRLPSVEGADTQRAGLYRIELDDGPSLPFAVQYDPREGDLERSSGSELAGLHEALVLLDPDETEGPADSGLPRQGELWRWLAMACLIALVLESLWAAWIGLRRSTP